MKNNLSSYIEKAMSELSTKSLKKIQIETALTWCGRACAASDLGLGHEAVEYAHESIEHAALSGNYALLRNIRAALKRRGVVV